MSYTSTALLDAKQSVRVASTANLNLAAPGASIDSVALSVGDRFLAKNQTTASENGIYRWNGAATPASRTSDGRDGNLSTGAIVHVAQGTANQNKFFFLSTNDPIAVGVTSLQFDDLSSAITDATTVSDTFSVNLTKTGNDITADVIPHPLLGLEILASGLGIKLQDDPTAVVATGENRLRFVTGTGDLTFLPDGSLMQGVADGSSVNLPALITVVSGNSVSATYTNPLTVPVYATFLSSIALTAVASADALPPAGYRLMSQQFRVTSGGSTTGTVVQGIGTAASTDYNNATNLVTHGRALRFRHPVSTSWLLQPGQVAHAQVNLLALEDILGWTSTVGAGSSFQGVSNRWIIQPQRQ